MKQLFWKEWHEMRLLPMVTALLFLLLTTTFLMLCVHRIAAEEFPRDFNVGETLGILCLSWMISAVVAGAGLFSQEIGGGTLPMLLMLPVSRARLWCIKITAAAAIMVAGVGLSSLAWVAFLLAVFGTKVVPLAIHARGIPENGLLFAAACLTVGTMASVFVDRHTAAALTALTAMLSLTYLYSVFTFSLTPDATMEHRQIFTDAVVRRLLCLTALSVPAYAAVSYWVFTRGEMLRSPKRFRVGGMAGAFSLGVAGLAFWTGLHLNWW